MTTMNLTLKESVHVLTLTNGDNDNKLNMSVLAEYHNALDTVESYEGDTSLLLTCEHTKTFSTGVDLEWFNEQDGATKKIFWSSFDHVLYRLMLLNMPTVSAINGNCYAGGALLACTTDFRIMRSDRGRFCFPEVNIKVPFTAFMVDVINQIPNKHILKHMALTGAAYTGEQCKEFNIVDDIFEQSQLQSEAFAMAKELAKKDRKNYSIIKSLMHKNIARM